VTEVITISWATSVTMPVMASVATTLRSV
jgi:hypothetical protein